MDKEYQKGYLAMALDMCGYDKGDIELVIKSYEFVTKNVSKNDAQDFYNKKSYIHEKKEGGK